VFLPLIQDYKKEWRVMKGNWTPGQGGENGVASGERSNETRIEEEN